MIQSQKESALNIIYDVLDFLYSGKVEKNTMTNGMKPNTQHFSAPYSDTIISQTNNRLRTMAVSFLWIFAISSVVVSTTTSNNRHIFSVSAFTPPMATTDMSPAFVCEPNTINTNNLYYPRSLKRRKKESIICYMGLRSFFKNKKSDDNSASDDGEKKKKFQNKEINQNKISDKLEEEKETLDDSFDDIITAGEEEEEEVINESVQERIQRVKSGKMTYDEKEAFLKGVLERPTFFPTSNEPPKNPAPLRQKTPLQDVLPSALPSLIKSTRPPSTSPSTPSPFSDSLWNTVIGAGNEETQNIINKSFPLPSSIDASSVGSASGSYSGPPLGSGQSMTEDQKREWFNMVTNPYRFNSFSTYPSQVPDRTIDETETETINQDQDLFASNEEEGDESQEELVKDVTNLSETTEAKPSTPPSNLASRLEQAAILHEKESADRRRKREEEIQKKKELEEIKIKKLEEEAKQREIEGLKRQEQVARKRKEQEMKLKKVEEERILKEKEKIKLMQERQDAYWNKKLAEEQRNKEARATQLSQPIQDQVVEDVSIQADNTLQSDQNEAVVDETAESGIDTMEASGIDEVDKATETEDIIQKTRDEMARISRSNYNQKMKQNKKDFNPFSYSSPASSSPPPKSSETSEFLMEQARKKRALDDMLEQQRRRLSEMNSPLPSPGSKKDLGVRPIIPEKTRMTNPSPPPQQQPPKLTDFVKLSPPVSSKVEKSVSKSVSAPPPSPPISSSPIGPANSIFNWGSFGSKTAIPPPPASKQTTPKPKPSVKVPVVASSPKTVPASVPAPAPASYPRLSLTEMTMFNGGTTTSNKSNESSTKNNKDPVAKAKPVQQDTPPSSSLSPPKPIRQQVGNNKEQNIPSRKGPIRMQLNIDDDDDDDEEEQTPRKIDIPEDQKKKANMWGINLDLL